MTPAQFWAICQISRTSEPSRSAARMVLVDGKTTVEAAAETGTLQPSVARLVGRLRRAHELLAEAYGPQEPRSAARA